MEELKVKTYIIRNAKIREINQKAHLSMLYMENRSRCFWFSGNLSAFDVGDIVYELLHGEIYSQAWIIGIKKAEDLSSQESKKDR